VLVADEVPGDGVDGAAEDRRDDAKDLTHGAPRPGREPSEVHGNRVLVGGLGGRERARDRITRANNTSRK
jgi:hypothetical protein